MTINKKAALEDLMESIYELVTVCGGWDAECNNVKPGVQEQLDRIAHLAEEAIND